jgi:hypothetical protein
LRPGYGFDIDNDSATGQGSGIDNGSATGQGSGIDNGFGFGSGDEGPRGTTWGLFRCHQNFFPQAWLVVKQSIFMAFSILRLGHSG